MTQRDAFEAALDADPADWGTRLVFSDWLEERGEDALAAAMKYMGTMQRCPLDSSPGAWWGWYTWTAQSHTDYSELPAALVKRMPGATSHNWRQQEQWQAMLDTRRAAEAALARVIHLLEPADWQPTEITP